MAKAKKCCRNPNVAGNKAPDCPPAQIKKCHGNVKKHPCAKKDWPEIGY